jgi:5-methylcytosine-specific restriction endonuclease McrA
MSKVKCGTIQGYDKHARDKTTKCDPCREAMKQHARIRYLEKRELILSQKKDYYEKNKETIKSNRTKRYYENPEAASEIMKRYRAKRPEAVIRAKTRRRAKLRGNGYEFYTTEQVLQTYGTDCNICNRPIDMKAPRLPGKPGWEMSLHIDHLIPISKDGPDTLDNVRPTHGICNIRKHNKV